ncbi:MAG: peroxiredoxin [Proteobacteria bacterium]|nr:peroxiredoxin [Pseudomonadota bacterium]
MLLENHPIPEFSALLAENMRVTQDNFKTGTFVFYFYPKDDTPGCTKQACDFRDSFLKFKEQNIEIYGISKDPLLKHDKFKEKYTLPFPLLTDDTGTLCDAFNVFKEKSFMGKKYKGIERSTFIIQNGIITKIWRKVSVIGHVSQVLKILNTQ